MYSYNTEKGYTPEKIQEIVNDLPPYFILAMLEFPNAFAEYKTKPRFSSITEKVSKHLDQHECSIEEFLSRDDPDAKKIWALLFKRDIGPY